MKLRIIQRGDYYVIQRRCWCFLWDDEPTNSGCGITYFKTFKEAIIELALYVKNLESAKKPKDIVKFVYTNKTPIETLEQQYKDE
jgi:hypothetical protein